MGSGGSRGMLPASNANQVRRICRTIRRSSADRCPNIAPAGRTGRASSRVRRFSNRQKRGSFARLPAAELRCRPDDWRERLEPTSPRTPGGGFLLASGPGADAASADWPEHVSAPPPPGPDRAIDPALFCARHKGTASPTPGGAGGRQVRSEKVAVDCGTNRDRKTTRPARAGSTLGR